MKSERSWNCYKISQVRWFATNVLELFTCCKVHSTAGLHKGALTQRASKFSFHFWPDPKLSASGCEPESSPHHGKSDRTFEFRVKSSSDLRYG
jgi:hypothetical protein